MIQLKKVSKFYRKQGKISSEIFLNLNTEINEKDFICLLGGNGTGKTTLLRLIKKIILPNTGVVKYSNDIDDGCIALVSQNYRSFFLNLTLEQNLEFFIGISGKDRKVDVELKEKLLKGFELIDYKQSFLSELSAGQLKKLSLIRSILQQPKIFLFDEVASSIDSRSKDYLMNFLRELIASQKIYAVVWATHNPSEVDKMYTKTWVLKDCNIKSQIK